MEASSIASELLSAELPRRWNHVVGVSRRGRDVLDDLVDESTGLLLEAAGVLHDIGYANPLVETGFHPLDGARYLRSIGFDERVVNLVAHHSCARIEAQLRGLDRFLEADFSIDRSLPHDELCFCDMTTSPDGELVTVEHRLADVMKRYGPGSVVYDFIETAGDELRAIVHRVEAQTLQGTS